MLTKQALVRALILFLGSLILALESLGYHGTVMHGEGLGTKEDKSIIFIVVELNKLRVLRKLIYENDPEAYMVVMDASELLGRGDGRF